MMEHNSNIENSRKTIIHTLHKTLNPTPHAILTYGSIHQTHYTPNLSDINILVTLTDAADLTQIRQQLIPWWDAHKAIIKSPPLVGHNTAVTNYLKLNPLLRHHIEQIGQSSPSQSIKFPSETAIHTPSYAYLAQQAFHASSELFTSTNTTDLSRLMRQISRNPTPATQQPLRQLSTIWQTIARQTDHLIKPSSPPPNEPPYPIKNLVSLYTKLDTLIIIIPSAIDLYQTDWSAITTQLQQDHYTHIHLTTPNQFRLMLHHFGALDLRLLTYDHIWGTDVLENLTPSSSDICYAAARYASHLQLTYYANHYFCDPITAEHGGYHIHALQNKLLNVRLQNEILVRIKLVDPPPVHEPLPGRETPNPQRFKAIYEHLTWWINYYIAEAKKA